MSGARASRVNRWLVVVVIVVGTPAHASPDPTRLPGWGRYDTLCLACHGRAGDGRGPAAPYTRGRPRDLTRGELAWRTTAWGQPGTDADLRQTIARGVAGTSMPAFADTLTPVELDELVAIVRAFGPTSTRGTPIALGPPPNPDPARGAVLWASRGCPSCHGDDGRGHGPAAATLALAPYDLTAEPLHRPTTTSLRATAAWSIATGMTGTPMPGYAGSIADDDVWALADHVVTLGRTAAARPSRDLDPVAIDLDRAAPIANGTWPGANDPDAAIWGSLVAPQGPPPPGLAPAEASLDPTQCARCHAKQYREWRASLHRGAVSSGYLAQTFALDPKARASCKKCHAPLAEQATDVALQSQGVLCAGCHVRGWTRNGPPGVDRALLPRPGYPLVTRPIYERGDFCMACHQLAPRTALAGRPLLDTYREWLEGPYMRRGIECQHCHMSNREHAWKGIHDAPTVAAAIALDVSAHRGTSGVVTVIARLRNQGAGHDLPTTPTPAITVTVELRDARDAPIRGARAAYRIGRDLAWTAQGWVEHADTRLPPGERVVIARAWQKGRVAEATHATIRVVVSPDDYYLRLYEDRLRGTLPAARRLLYEAALQRARADVYTAEERVVPIATRM